jgi:hypothetical protein
MILKSYLIDKEVIRQAQQDYLDYFEFKRRKQMTTPTAGSVEADIAIFSSSVKSIQVLVAAIERGDATTVQTLQALYGLMQDTAIFFPAIAQYEGYVNAAIGVVAAIEFLTGKPFIEVNHGPVHPVFGGPDGPERIFGFEVQK